MGDTNQFNKPNLVDYTLIQKLNQGYHHHGTISRVPSLFQKAGSFSFNLIKENLFMSIILLLLVIFLAWCYVEKQRQDNILEKLYQKKMAKVMLEDELQLFTDIPVELNINDLFKDINNDLNSPVSSAEMAVKPAPDSDPILELETKAQSYQTMPSKKKDRQMLNGINPTAVIPSNSANNYMNVTDFNPNSYMLL
jgi:hypothetical protein